MRKQRIYVDTSVIGGCFDPEFEVWSNGLIDDFRKGRFFNGFNGVGPRKLIDMKRIIAVFVL